MGEEKCRERVTCSRWCRWRVMHREEGVSWGHLQEKGHRRHMEVGEGEGDNQGVDSVEKVSCQLYFKQVNISHSPDSVYIVWSKNW